jgi:hypothetical protein
VGPGRDDDAPAASGWRTTGADGAGAVLGGALTDTEATAIGGLTARTTVSGAVAASAGSAPRSSTGALGASVARR